MLASDMAERVDGKGQLFKGEGSGFKEETLGARAKLRSGEWKREVRRAREKWSRGKCEAYGMWKGQP